MPTWTTTPPTQPGLYWWRPRLGAESEAVRVRPASVAEAHAFALAPGELAVDWHGSDPTRLAGTRGEWWGPLVPPGDGGAVVSDSDRGPATADGEPWKGV